MAEAIVSRFRLRRSTAAIAIVFFVIILGIGLYLRSQRFNDWVRHRVIDDLERVTGGKVEIGSLSWRLSRLSFSLQDITVHGSEPAGTAPYIHVDALNVGITVVSLVERQIALRYLSAHHPVIHIITYPDGRTNQPYARRASISGGTLFRLSVSRAQVERGEIIWNQRSIPLDVDAQHVVAILRYAPDEQSKRAEYIADVSIGEISTVVKHSLPVLASAAFQIGLRSTAIDIRQFRIASGSSRLQGNGVIQDFVNPHVEIAYHAFLDAAFARQIGALAERGSVDINARFFGTPSNWTTSGSIVSHSLDLSSPWFRVSGLNGRADFALSPKRIELRHLDADLLHGEVAGSAEIIDWRTHAQRGHAEVKLTQVSASDLLQSCVACKKNSAITFNSVADAKLTAEWKGSPQDANVAIDASFAAGKAPGVPLSGSAVAEYSHARSLLQIAHLEAHTPTANLNASGMLSGSSRLQFALAESDPVELKAVARALLPYSDAPLSLNGSIQVKGTADGPVSAPTIHAHVAVTDFQTLVPSTGIIYRPNRPTHPTSWRALHWQSFTGDVTYAGHDVTVTRGDLRDGTMRLLFNGDLRTGPSTSVIELPLHAHVISTQLTPTLVSAIVGQDLPYTGAIDAVLDLNGPLGDLHGDGPIEMAGGTAKGIPFRSMHAAISFSGDFIALDHVRIAQDGGALTGKVHFDFVNSSFALDAQGTGFEIAHLNLRSPRMTAPSGKIDFQMHAKGTPSSPTLDAHATVTNLAFGSEQVGGFVFDAGTEGENLRFTGHSLNARSSLSLQGEIGLSSDHRGSARLVFSELDLDPLLNAYLPGKLTGHSSFTGRIDASGPFGDPKSLTVVGEIDRAHAAIEDVQLQNQGAIRFSVRDQTVHLARLQLTGSGTDLTAAGSFQFAGQHAINANAGGTIDLRLLHSIDSSVLSNGLAVFNISANGTLDAPAVNGEIDVQNASFAIRGLPNALSAMNGRLIFNQDRFVVQQLTAKSGGGDVRIGGFVTYRSGIYFDLSTRGRDIRVRYPEGVSSTANADLRITGTLNGAVISGGIILTKFGVTQNFDLESFVARSKEAPAAPQPGEMGNKLRLEVRLTSSPELSVETSLATLTGDIDLTIRGTVADPAILGRISIASGDVTFNGTKYRLDRADLTFNNPLRMDPIINLQASTSVTGYDISLGFHGPLDKMNTSYRSEPPLPTADILSLLAFQRPAAQTQTNATLSDYTESAQNAVLGSALNAAVSNRISKLFGVSRIEINPSGTGLETNKPSITVEQQIQNKLTVTFVTYPTQTNQEVIQVEYAINRNLSIVALRDQYGVLSFDVRLKQRKR